MIRDTIRDLAGSLLGISKYSHAGEKNSMSPGKGTPMMHVRWGEVGCVTVTSSTKCSIGANCEQHP